MCPLSVFNVVIIFVITPNNEMTHIFLLYIFLIMSMNKHSNFYQVNLATHLNLFVPLKISLKVPPAAIKSYVFVEFNF